ncbi:cardiolipin synthase [Peptacetobacter hiranonis]|uniref:cardiolipin synthase n=1 Tax=Peptacetobacter hiranonis TaxID=89152 RepID=UPI002E75FF05|nr:cardiolipin synthase [Peptacetobacter hiranonis]MEE0247673.1 cardiolipin synthase [Peptacetobacter hiranonis]
MGNLPLSLFEIVLTAIYLINFILVVDLIFRGKRNIDNTLTWIVILVLVPPVGFILYAMFGRSIAKKNMFSVKEKEDKVIKDKILESYVEIESNLDPYLDENKDIIYTLANSNNAHFTADNDVDIYPESNLFFNSLLEELKKAEEYINIQFYIFKDDRIGKEIIEILKEKAQSGVEVRLLYDAVGGRNLSRKAVKEMKEAGVQVANFFPSFLNIINFNINFRNHRKIVVIDGKVGFVGGFNVGDEYLGRDPKFGEWRDTHIRLTGSCVIDLSMRFLLDWRYTTKENLDLAKYFTKKREKSTGNVGIQIVSSGPDITELDEIKYGYMKMIQKARDYVYIQSPYLILDKTLMETLKVACLSGVDVRIMIPSKPDHPFVYWASYSYAGELLDYGAKIYTYGEDAFLHAKTIVYDDSVASIGTANMDIRSFELNFEVNAFIYSEEKAREQRMIFEKDIENSREITKEIYESRSTYIKIKESISRLLSPVL